MAEIHTITGYGPERFIRALHVMQETDATALVFRGLVTSIHDELVRTHNQYYMQPDRRFATGQGIIDLADVGIDVARFDAEQIASPDRPDAEVRHTTVDLVEKGKGLTWHNDVQCVGPYSPGQVYIPDGVSVSMNLVGSVRFHVDLDVSALPLPARQMTRSEIDSLVQNANLQHRGLEPKKPATIDLNPGDVIFWKQPAYHAVTMQQPDRRAIVLIQEDLVIAKEF